MSDNKDTHGREMPDPDEAPAPIPWYVVMAIGALSMWSMFYINDAYMGVDDYEGDNRPVPVAVNPLAVAAVPAFDGAAIFQGKCVACHQATGMGITGLFPPLADSEWVLGDETRLAAILLHGIIGKLTVKGVEYNGQMPAFGAMLSDGEIAAVLTHVRSQWGNAGEAVDEATVAKVREATKDKTVPWNGDAELTDLTFN